MSHYAVTVSIGAQPAWTRAGQREPCDVISQQCLWNHALDYNSGNTCVLRYYTFANFQTFTRHILIFCIVGAFTQTINQPTPMHTCAVDFFAVGGVAFGEYHNHTCAEDRTVIVQLFNWLWTDIEKECVDYLGPKGFCGVQVCLCINHRQNSIQATCRWMYIM